MKKKKENAQKRIQSLSIAAPVPVFCLGRLRKLILSLSDSFPIPNPIGSVRNSRLLRAGDGGLEEAGEKTPTPDNFSLENSDASNLASSPKPSRVG